MYILNKFVCIIIYIVYKVVCAQSCNCLNMYIYKNNIIFNINFEKFFFFGIKLDFIGLSLFYFINGFKYAQSFFNELF